MAFVSAIAIGLLILLTHSDYGMTWDEEVQKTYGNLILAYFGSGFANKFAMDYLDLKFYGGAFELLVQLVTYWLVPLTGADLFDVRHLLNALTGFTAVFFAYRSVRLVASGRAAFAAAFLLITMPRFWGHSFNNPKDIPFAAAYSLAIFAIIRFVLEFPAPSRKAAVQLGLMIGLAMAVRVGGLILWAVLALAWLLQWAARGGRPVQFLTLRNFSRMSLAFGVAWLTMILPWPYAQADPFFRPLETLQLMSHFAWTQTVLFDGQMMPAPDLPSTYLPVWFAITLPDHFLVLFLGAILIIALGRLCRRDGRHQESVEDGEAPPRFPAATFFFLAAVLPVLIAIVLDSVVYDGMRHFLFVLPLLSMGAALLVDRALEQKARWLVTGWIAVSVGSFALVFLDMVQLHPYQAIYFNRSTIGGLAGAAGRFETDYWGNSYRAAAHWVSQHYPAGTAVSTCGAEAQVDYYLNHSEYMAREQILTDILWGRRPAVDLVPLLQKGENRQGKYPIVKTGAKLFLATTRFHCHLSQPGEVVYKVMAQNVELLRVVQVR
ncbi:MAG: glycosyltransferase family 39 protein [Spirochaetales bacterium]|nr:glycosyltransferase family 39 protein [Spirochaetales bacterium]